MDQPRRLCLSLTASTQGTTVVELDVSQNAMPQVAAAAASGQVALATIATGG
jgi:hypothetical protein